MASSNINAPIQTPQSCFSGSDDESKNSGSFQLAPRSVMIGDIAVNIPNDPTLEDTATTKGDLNVAGPSNPSMNPKIVKIGETEIAPIILQSESVGGINESVGHANPAQSGNQDVSVSMGPASSKMVVPEGNRIDIKRNNCSLNFKSNAFVAEQQIIIEILKNHPFKMLLSRTSLVPEDYLQQWWHFAELDDNEEEFCSYVAGFRFAVKISDIRSMFGLPSESAVVGKTSFDSIPINSELISDFLKLGYNEDLTTLSSFRRKCLPPVWYTLFSFVNTCLSGKHSSLDQASTNIRIIFHGIAHNRHYDYAKLIFEEMRTAIIKKNTYSYIPFQRFFQIFIKAAMRTVQDIPSLSNATHVQKFSLDSMRPPSTNKVFETSSPLPKELLAYVNPRNEVLVSYLESMQSQEPEIATQDSPLSDEVRVRVTKESGDAAQVGEQYQSDESPVKDMKKVRKVRKIRKRIKERRTQEKELQTCAPTDTIRATTQSDAPHSLEDIIETAEPKAKFVNPHIHSSASEKADVSITLMEQTTYEPVGPHLEEPIVETGGRMSPLPSVVHFESLEPTRSQDDQFFHTDTSPSDFNKQNVRHFVQTTIGDPSMDIQGLVGSPGGVNILKTPFQESFVDSGAVAPTGQAAQAAVLKTVPSVGTGNITQSSEFQQFKDFCSIEFEKIHKNIQELTDKTNSEVEDRVVKVVGELKSDIVKKADLTSFQNSILSSFSKVAESVNALKVTSESSSSELATKSDIQLILNQLSAVQSVQADLDKRLTVVEINSVSLKRGQVDQGGDQLEGENSKRMKLTEDISLVSEAVAEFDFDMVGEEEEEKVDEEINGDDEGYETEKVELEYEEDEIYSEYTDVNPDSNEEMVNEYMEIEEKFGEPEDLSDVIVFETIEDCSGISEQVIEENLDRQIVVWKGVQTYGISDITQKCFNLLRDMIVLRSGFLNSYFSFLLIPRSLEIFKEFVCQEPVKEDLTLCTNHIILDDGRSVCYESLSDELWSSVTREVEVCFRMPIEIPRLELNILEAPIIDRVFRKDTFYLEDVNEMLIFPEHVHSDMYRLSMKNATLESFFDHKWTDEFCEEVKDFLSKYGSMSIQSPILIKRILQIVTEVKDGFSVIMIGAEKRDGTLIEFSQYEIYYLRLQDKLTLLNYCVTREIIELGKEIRRVLGIYCRNLSKHDFQLALERKLKKVNLLEPCSADYSSETTNVFLVPEIGFHYKDEESYCYGSFFISDIPKYSDSTLEWMIQYLSGRFLKYQKIVDEIIFLIKERMQFRELVRRVFTIAYAEENSRRDADYLLSNSYDFVIHANEQVIPFEVPEVEVAKGKRKLSEIATSEPESVKKRILEDRVIDVKEKEKEIVEEKEISEKKMSEAELVLQSRVQEHALTLFLEYFHPEMFFDTDQRFDFIDCWLKKSLGWKLWYSRMINDLKQNVQKVRKNSQIKKVISADLKSRGNFQYSSFKVEREDGEVCVFSEADFQNLYIKDLIKVYQRMNPFHDKVAKFRKTFPTLRDGIYREFIWAAKTDFYIAYILGKEKVLLKRPNFHLDGIENVSRGTLLLYPPGFVCKCQDQKLFVRTEELHKCCNGTLMAIFERLMKKQRRKPKNMKDDVWMEYQIVAKNFCEKIEGLIEYRRVILGEVLPILTEWNYDLSF